MFFGRAAARLDDIANFLPSRLTAGLVVVAAFLLNLRWRKAFRIVLRDASTQPSPNSGYPESAFAGALCIRLGGTNFYDGRQIQKAYIGDPERQTGFGPVSGSAPTAIRNFGTNGLGGRRSSSHFARSRMNSPAHGGDVWAAARRRGISVRRIVDFSASINPLGLAPKARRRLKRDIDLISHYPDKRQEELRALVASREGVHPDCILFGNGATQLIHCIPRALGCRKALIIEPSFSEYRAAVESHGAKVVEFRTDVARSFELDLKAFLHAVQIERPDLIFLGNPNNPTGVSIPRRTLSRVIKFCTNHRVDLVVDESFIEFSEQDSLAAVAARQPHLIVVRSFTKCFALAGLRIGYLVGHRSIVDKIALTVEPWSVNTLALAAAAESLKDSGYLCKTLALIRKERHYLSQGLAKLVGFSRSLQRRTTCWFTSKRKA